MRKPMEVHTFKVFAHHDIPENVRNALLKAQDGNTIGRVAKGGFIKFTVNHCIPEALCEGHDIIQAWLISLGASSGDEETVLIQWDW